MTDNSFTDIYSTRAAPNLRKNVTSTAVDTVVHYREINTVRERNTKP